MSSLPWEQAVFTVHVDTHDGHHYRSRNDLVEHVIGWIRGALTHRCAIEHVLVTPHPEMTDDEDREEQLDTLRQMIVDCEFAPRGSFVDGSFLFLLGEIDRLRALAGPAVDEG